jgi:hypothetical protein
MNLPPMGICICNCIFSPISAVLLLMKKSEKGKILDGIFI